jgi:hypothetical protein
MSSLRLRHHNNCPRGPIIGAENIPGDEYFEFRSLRFSLQAARRLMKPSMLHRVDHTRLANWLEHVFIDPRHVDHLPAEIGPGIMVTFPSGLGRPLIDGNHRAARALGSGTESMFTFCLRRRRWNCFAAAWAGPWPMPYWQRMADAQPHPDDVPQGEQR